MTEIPEHERTAFEALYAEHYWALLRYAVRRTPDRESARDLVADTFATAWQRRDRMPPDRTLPWLYRIAGNLLANRRRRTARATDAIRRLARNADDQHPAAPTSRSSGQVRCTRSWPTCARSATGIARC